MRKALFAFSCVLIGLIALGSAKGQQATTNKAKVYLRVLVPTEHTKVLIDDQPTKQTGASRLYVSPALAPDKQFTYTVTAKWWPNNYTEVSRTRVVNIKAGQEVEVDLRKPDDKFPDDYRIRYVSTPEEVVDAMCKLAGVGKDDVVYDLGCGDAVMLIRPLLKHGAKRGVGIDIDLKMVKIAKEKVKEANLEKKIEIREGDILNVKDMSEASVVLLYIGDDLGERLSPVLQKTLKPGARIVSHRFSLGDWKPDKTITVKGEDGDEYDLLLWTITEKKKAEKKIEAKRIGD